MVCPGDYGTRTTAIDDALIPPVIPLLNAVFSTFKPPVEAHMLS